MGRFKVYYWGVWRERYALTAESELELVWTIFQKILEMGGRNKELWMSEKVGFIDKRSLLKSGWKIKGKINVGGNCMRLTFCGGCYACEVLRQLLADYTEGRLVMSYKGVSE